MTASARRWWIIGVGGLVAVAAAVSHSLRDSPTPAAIPRTSDHASQVQHGEYLARAGDCMACHTASNGAPYAGGAALNTQFGAFYAPNITPDAEHGIGAWTADDFWRALHEGRSRNGELLYPAFPYTNYTRITRADADDMFVYLRTIPPSRQARRAHELRFPYNERKLLAAWRALYFHPGEYAQDRAKDGQWNRGAYLVTGLGHCDACHSARNALGAVPADKEIMGGLIPVQNWYAPSLTSNRETGLGDWDVEEVVDLLKTGVSARGAVYGPMATVVHQSLQYLMEVDLTAMAIYLKSQIQVGEPPEPAQVKVPAAQGEALVAQGGRLYEKQCAPCHQRHGEGVPRIYPPLANNESILMPYPINAIRIVVNGGFPPSTLGNPRPYGMPPFGQDLSDEQIAAVVSYIRQSWGNHASPVSPAEVSSARGIPVE